MTTPHSLPPNEPQITQVERLITLGVLAVIIVGCYYVIRPFLSALVWAFIL